jgi:predicted  nucleic acid-binding Zn-ribbon protein
MDGVMGNNEPSVAEALGRAHAALLEDLRKLEGAALPAFGEGLAELRARLDATRRHITEHFRFEEQNGYMDAVRKREPRLERTIEQLAQEHRELEQSLEALIGESEVVTGLGAAYREKVRRWVEHVRQHEARENDLVLDAFNLDISAED